MLNSKEKTDFLNWNFISYPTFLLLILVLVTMPIANAKFVHSHTTSGNAQIATFDIKLTPPNDLNITDNNFLIFTTDGLIKEKEYIFSLENLSEVTVSCHVVAISDAGFILPIITMQPKNILLTPDETSEFSIFINEYTIGTHHFTLKVIVEQVD
jgi:hypothetical protein